MRTTYKVSDNIYIHSDRGLFDFDIWDFIAAIAFCVGYVLGFVGIFWFLLYISGMPNADIFDMFFSIAKFIIGFCLACLGVGQ